ncbi:MAG TPA: hypothetical protein VMZ30_03705 [Pyrinomonadaceae bacterium]|nr:hypothetical protein [Pyrinomonadaceae bacterium]
MAAQLRKETGAQVELVRGELGEFSVYVDDRKVMDTNRLWYPTPNKVVEKISAVLRGE